MLSLLLRLLLTVLIASLPSNAFPRSHLRKVDVGLFKGAANIMPGGYLVEMPGVSNCPSEIVTYLTKASPALKESDIQIRHVIKTKLFNGVSFLIRGDVDERVIKSIPGASNVFNIQHVPRPRPMAIIPNATATDNGDPGSLNAIHQMTGVLEARNKFGVTGKGIKVAVIDGGVDYKHPALGGCFGAGCKVIKGYDFTGDRYPETQPDPDPLDNCSPDSHGTHVAGIVAGDSTHIEDPAFLPSVAPALGESAPLEKWTGVAPGASLMAYRVFDCRSGQAGDDAIASAVYMATEDGADIINMSLGVSTGYSNDVLPAALSRVADEANVMVMVAQGNEQKNGGFYTSVPAVAGKAFGIASVDNLGSQLRFMVVFGEGEGIKRWPISVGENVKFPETQLEVIANDLEADAKDTQEDGCAENPSVDATGKAMLIRWGDSAHGGSRKRCGYAFKANAAACIFYNNLDDGAPGIFGDASIPSLMTTREAGQAIIRILRSNKMAFLSFSNQTTGFKIATGGTISEYSSTGPDPDLNLKPELAGVGGQVLSTISRHAKEVQGGSGGPYAIYSGSWHLLIFCDLTFGFREGTSMASPYVAGVAALVLEYWRRQGRGSPSITELKRILQNSAVPVLKHNTDMVDSVASQGAGLVNALRAIGGVLKVEPSALTLNDTANTLVRYTIQVTNVGSEDKQVRISSRGAAMMSSFKAGDDAVQTMGETSYTASYAKVVFAVGGGQPMESADLTIPGGGSTNVEVSFSPPTDAVPGLYPVYSGYIYLSSVIYDTGVTPSASRFIEAFVPYIGMVGAWRDKSIWQRSSPSMDALLQRPEIKKGLNGIGFKIAANATIATGLYDARAANLLPIRHGHRLNGTDGIFVVANALVTTRYGAVEVIYAGDDPNLADSVNDSPGLDSSSTEMLSSMSHRRRAPASKPTWFVKALTSFNLGDAAFATPDTGIAISSGPILVSSPLPRCVPSVTSNAPPSIHLWTGWVHVVQSAGGTIATAAEISRGKRVRLPRGWYRVRFVGVRNLENVDGGQTDEVLTEDFELVY
ncbi:hypothetical protein HDU97_002402 [Phlyctochytrium planicorne]|nr:hypothetical protein HDU97_002402 [Phlyctochytrium planicorne]